MHDNLVDHHLIILYFLFQASVLSLELYVLVLEYVCLLFSRVQALHQIFAVHLLQSLESLHFGRGLDGKVIFLHSHETSTESQVSRAVGGRRTSLSSHLHELGSRNGCLAGRVPTLP